MNHMFQLLNKTSIIISFFLLHTILSNHICNALSVLDSTGTPIKPGTSYEVVLANEINDPYAQGIGLYCFNQTCPLHVALRVTASSLKFIPRLSYSPRDVLSRSPVKEKERVHIVFDYGGRDCSEPNMWQVTTVPKQSYNMSHEYVKTGSVTANDNFDSGFEIKNVDTEKHVYKFQFCRDSAVGVSCKDVNVEGIMPNVTVLVLNFGVPLHVRFRKSWLSS